MHARLKKKIRKQPDNYKLCKRCAKKLKRASAKEEEPTLKFDMQKYIYDEMEIDYINEQQSKVFVSHVQINPFLTHGIRTHCKELTAAHCLHSVLDVRHRDFLPIWLHMVPLLWLVWEVLAIFVHQEDVYGFHSLDRSSAYMGVGLGLAIVWLMARVTYLVFYPLGYGVEGGLDKASAITTTLLLFGYSIMFVQILIVPRFPEAGWIISYVMAVMLAANIVLTLNPVGAVEGQERQRGCCSNNYITLTLSVLVCMLLIEANNIVATPDQRQNFYKKIHTLVAIWLFALWIALQNVPERFVGQNGFLQKYLSSEVIKAAVLSSLVIALTFVLRDNLPHQASENVHPAVVAAAAPAPAQVHTEAPA